MKEAKISLPGIGKWPYLNTQIALRYLFSLFYDVFLQVLNWHVVFVQVDPSARTWNASLYCTRSVVCRMLGQLLKTVFKLLKQSILTDTLASTSGKLAEALTDCDNAMCLAPGWALPYLRRARVYKVRKPKYLKMFFIDLFLQTSFST